MSSKEQNMHDEQASEQNETQKFKQSKKLILNKQIYKPKNKR